MDRILCLLIELLTALSPLAKPLSRLGLGTYEQWQPGEKIKILLVGYNGARNTGSDVRVAAIARQLCDLLGRDRVAITVMTMDPSTMEGYFDEDVTLLTFSSLFPVDLYRACCRHHGAVLCEGSTLKSTFANALTLFLCEAAGIMSRQGKPCIAYGSEVGEMEPFLRRAAQRLCRDTFFIARNQPSLRRLEALGLHGCGGTDAAWRYDGAISDVQAKKRLMEQGWDGQKPLLGVAVIHPFCWPVRSSLGRWVKGHLTGDLSQQYDKWYFFSDSPQRRWADETYLREMAGGVNAFLHQRDYFPVLIGMERLDETACLALREKLERPSALFLSGTCSAPVMTGILRQLSALVTSRYHAAVLSMEGGCPIVAVSVDERLDSLMEELSFERYLLHVSDEGLGAQVTRGLLDACGQEQAIRQHLSQAVAHYRESLDDMGDRMKDYLLEALHGDTALPGSRQAH